MYFVSIVRKAELEDIPYIASMWIKLSEDQQGLWYFCAEKWASDHDLRYIVADVFEHNYKVAKLLGYLCKMELYRHRLVKQLEPLDFKKE